MRHRAGPVLHASGRRCATVPPLAGRGGRRAESLERERAAGPTLEEDIGCHRHLRARTGRCASPARRARCGRSCCRPPAVAGRRRQTRSSFASARPRTSIRSNPYQTALVVGYEAFGLTYDLLVDFGQNVEPVPGFAESWSAPPTARRGPSRSARGCCGPTASPRRPQDACFTCQINLDADRRDESLRRCLATSTRASRDAGVTEVECPDDKTLIADDDRPVATASSRPTSRSCPSTSGARWTTRRSARRRSTRRWSAPARTRSSSGRPASSRASSPQPRTTGASRARRTRSSSSSSAAPTRWSRRSSAGELDYAHGVNADQFDALKTEPDIVTVAGTGERLDRSSGSTPTAPGPATRSRTAARPRRRCSTRRSATPSATPSTRTRSSSASSAATATSAPPTIPPVLTEWHVEPTTPRTFDLALADQKLTDAGYVHGRGRQPAGQGGQPDQPEHGRARTTTTTYARGRPVHPELVRRARRQGHAQASTAGTLIDADAPAGGRRRAKADYDLFIWGWSRQPGPERPAPGLPVRRDRQLVRQPCCNPTYDALYDEQITRGGDERKAVLDRDADTDLRRGAVPHPVLRRQPARLPERPVRGLAEPAGERHAALRLRHARATRCSRRPRPPRASRRRPRPTDGSSAAPATPAPSGNGGDGRPAATTPLLIVGVLAVVVVVVRRARPRSTAGARPKRTSRPLVPCDVG